jgi:predicted transcriptional regulator
MSIFNRREELYQDLVKAIKESIVELKPENRYILILPVENENLADSVEQALRTLELEKTNVRMAFLVGDNIKIMEIS